MKTIYKFNITSAEGGTIKGPIIKLLDVQVQNSNLVVWAEVDTSLPDRKFLFIPVCTGMPLDGEVFGKENFFNTFSYLGTVQLPTLSLVFHMYVAEILEEAETKIKAKTDKNKEVTFTSTNCVINPKVLKQFLE